MLDFYLLDDDQEMPDYPEKAELVLMFSLTLKEFEQLQKNTICTSEFDYFSDFRILSEELSKVLDQVENLAIYNHKLKMIQELKELSKKGIGLAAFCD